MCQLTDTNRSFGLISKREQRKDTKLFVERKIYNFYEPRKKRIEICEERSCYVVVSLLREDETFFMSLGKGVKKERKTRICSRREDLRRYITIAVMMAKRIHLFPFRTQKLSSFTPKVLAVNRREDR